MNLASSILAGRVGEGPAKGTAMSRQLRTLFSVATYGFLSFSLATGVAAQTPGEQVEGVIAEVDGRSLIVDREGGGRVTARLGARTHVVVHPRQGGHFPNTSTDFLKAGMGVRFKWAAGPLDRVHVTSVPAGAWPEPSSELRPPAAPPATTPRASQTETLMKVRITDVGRGEAFTADVAGRKRVFQTTRPGLTRRFQEGDLVVVTVDPDGRVSAIRPATLSGRVVHVDPRRGRLTIEVDGREESYQVEDRGLLDDVARGERIRFEVEERGAGRQVVTAIF